MDGFTVKNSNRFLETGRMSSDWGSGAGVGNRLTGTSSSGNEIGDSSLQTTGTDGNKSFAATLNDAIQSVNKLQHDSNIASQNLATGRTDNIAEVMIASEKADIALRLMVQVRNKIIDAYQEVMKMQV